jgi:hypothetical protein
MKTLIENGIALRKYLGSHLSVIQSLDPLPKERRRTQIFRKKLINKYGSICCLCLEKRAVEAAHIIPLEIGAKTAEPNLVLLCSTCHKLYDTGHLSISAMEKLASEWRQGKRKQPLIFNSSKMPLTSATITPPPKKIMETLDKILVLQRRTELVKATELANAELKKHPKNSNEHLCLLIKIAELTRRRAKRGVLPTALEILESIEVDRLDPQYHPLYYYELNYVYRLFGWHMEAAKAILKSSQSSMRSKKNSGLGVDYVAAEVNALLCKLSIMKTLSKRQAQDIVREFSRLTLIASKNGAYWGGRWAINSEAHKVQVHIKAGDPERSWKSLNKTKQIYFSADLSSGWDLASRGSLSLLDGMVHVLFPRQDSDLEHGIRILARSFAGRVGPRKRPEGIRDVGYSLALGLKRLNNTRYSETVALLTAAMDITLDGTSYVWPYTAEMTHENRTDG